MQASTTTPASTATAAVSSASEASFVQAIRHPNQVLELQLNRPKQLNALSLQMLRDLTIHVIKAITDETIHAVIITAVEGRAFCAGGDIKQILKGRLTENTPTPEGCDPRTYIRVEYKLDSSIYKLSEVKPVLAAADGIVMGGGAGIYQGARIRVVSPHSTFAMPEVRIALLPDAGAMWFLMRAPEQIPLYLALTGARLNGHDMRACGLASHLMEPHHIQELLHRLRTKDQVDPKAEADALAINPVNTPLIESRRPLINQIFSKPTVREIYESLKAERAKIADDEAASWIQDAINALELECPVSHVVTLHTVRKAQEAGNTWTVDEGLGVEFLANSYLAFRPDFIEGVETAVGSRKGEVPKWTLKNWDEASEDGGVKRLLAKITEGATVSQYFER